MNDDPRSRFPESHWRVARELFDDGAALRRPQIPDNAPWYVRHYGTSKRQATAQLLLSCVMSGTFFIDALNPDGPTWARIVAVPALLLIGMAAVCAVMARRWWHTHALLG